MAQRHYETKDVPGGGTLFYLSCFHEECVDRIKEEIPSGHRSWNEAEEAWLITGDYCQTAEEIVSEFFEEG